MLDGICHEAMDTTALRCCRQTTAPLSRVLCLRVKRRNWNMSGFQFNLRCVNYWVAHFRLFTNGRSKRPENIRGLTFSPTRPFVSVLFCHFFRRIEYFRVFGYSALCPPTHLWECVRRVCVWLCVGRGRGYPKSKYMSRHFAPYKGPFIN